MLSGGDRAKGVIELLGEALTSIEALAGVEDAPLRARKRVQREALKSASPPQPPTRS